ncbi:hypothetical protein [Alkalicoccobacillus murimartini]|uniref:Uncharacterized protein n=1 Tax=Alkalicoccobacillus murimartini TaxID=171685 RepID=A0ABT9YBS6_9BACI|nr:hypothetical protein [Alkalicoccobacillus murimartini]MDQ0205300.1 hypothetical protein [Alkalicoccobacillus murimartini]
MKRSQAKTKTESDQGKEKYFMDVDRMINEGLGGGKIAGHHAGRIEESRPLEQEDPPAKHE